MTYLTENRATYSNDDPLVPLKIRIRGLRPFWFPVQASLGTA